MRFDEQVDAEFLNIRLGILDDEPNVKPTLHVYGESRARWHEIADTLPRFETIPGAESSWIRPPAPRSRFSRAAACGEPRSSAIVGTGRILR